MTKKTEGPWDCGDKPCEVDRPFAHPIARRIDEILRRKDYSATEEWHDLIREEVLRLEQDAALVATIRAGYRSEIDALSERLIEADAATKRCTCGPPACAGDPHEHNCPAS